jgi:hypothetical protein
MFSVFLGLGFNPEDARDLRPEREVQDLGHAGLRIE